VPKDWVDFQAVKAAVTMRMALEHYGINWLRKRGDELRGRCPIHKGEGQNSFHASLNKGAFQCFSCSARGNVLDFVAAMEQCSIRDAAVKLQEWFSIPASNSQQGTKPKRAKAPENRAEAKAENQPLSFQLKGIDCGYAYLTERGISKQTAEEFGVGFFPGKGSMSGRVVIPIHNERGELVAYAGRAIDNSEPRYKLPAGFHKSLELFNLHRVMGEGASLGRIVVVEGFFDCMKMHQAGLPAVALMGCAMSEQQEELLARHFKQASLFLDGDDAGRKATDELLLRLGKRMWVRAILLEDGLQPDQLSAEELRARLEN